MIKDLNLVTQEDFANAILEIVKEKNLPFMDAVIHYCQENDLEVEMAAEYIKKNEKLMYHIRNEAAKLKMVKFKPSKLPI